MSSVAVDIKDIEDLVATFVALEDIMRSLRRDIEQHIVNSKKRPAARSHAVLRAVDHA